MVIDTARTPWAATYLARLGASRVSHRMVIEWRCTKALRSAVVCIDNGTVYIMPWLGVVKSDQAGHYWHQRARKQVDEVHGSEVRL